MMATRNLCLRLLSVAAYILAFLLLLVSYGTNYWYAINIPPPRNTTDRPKDITIYGRCHFGLWSICFNPPSSPRDIIKFYFRHEFVGNCITHSFSPVTILWDPKLDDGRGESGQNLACAILITVGILIMFCSGWYQIISCWPRKPCTTDRKPVQCVKMAGMLLLAAIFITACLVLFCVTQQSDIQNLPVESETHYTWSFVLACLGALLTCTSSALFFALAVKLSKDEVPEVMTAKKANEKRYAEQYYGRQFSFEEAENESVT